MVKIVTDSTCDIPEDLIKKFGITTVPIIIVFGTETYRERIDITPEQFYKRLVESKVHPTTAMQTPAAFAEVFTRLAKETDEILAIIFSSKISATYDSAVQAKAMVGDIAKIEVVDSLQSVGGLGLPVIKAAEMAAGGAKLAELAEATKDWCSRSHTYMVFDTLEYLRKGGRVGVVTPVQRTRSRTQAIDALVNLVKGANKIEALMLEDATTPDELEIVASRCAEIYPREKTYRSTVSPVIGVHVGPHVLCANFIEGK
ncbi:MAG: DegV family protein [Chloroflexi bacterium]|nr:DegV family protein [Chloroflexota bacterium]